MHAVSLIALNIFKIGHIAGLFM